MILGIETSAVLCSLAWYENQKILLEYNIEKEQVHSTLLASLYKQGMEYLNKSISDISLVAIATGPGSYTGLRIGMSFAKGLCFGGNIPIIGVSNFYVLALQKPIGDSGFFTLINANKNRFYFAKFESPYKNFVEEGILDLNQLNQKADINSGVITDNYTEIDKTTKPWNNFSWIVKARFNASYLCKVAENRFKKYGTDNLDELEPMYLQAFAGVL